MVTRVYWFIMIVSFAIMTAALLAGCAKPSRDGIDGAGIVRGLKEMGKY